MRIGIVGCGRFANRRIIPAIASIPELTLYGIQSRSKTLPVPFVTTDPKALIFHPEIHAIIICSPHHLHKEHLLLCAERNIPTLCEKPMTLSHQDYREVIQAFPQKTPLLVGQCHRFKDSLMQVRKILKSGELGAIHSIHIPVHIPVPKENWRHNATFGGGVLLDIGIHVIDAIHYLTESRFRYIHTVGTHTNVDTSVHALGQLENGTNVSFSLSFDYPYETGFTIVGSKGTIKGEYTFRQEEDMKETLTLKTPSDEIISLPFSRANIYERELSHFFEVCSQNNVSILDARSMEENYKALDLIQENLKGSQKRISVV